MGLKIRDDAPTLLTLYKRVGEYVDGTPRTGDARDFGPGEPIPDEYAAYIADAFKDSDNPEHDHIVSFVEGSLGESKSGSEDDKDPYDRPVSDLKEEVERRGLDVQGSGSGGRVSKRDLQDALRADDASSPTDTAPAVDPDNPFAAGT